MNELQKVNKQLDILQNELIRQLQTTNIQYIDLRTYYRQLEALKTKKDALYLDTI